MAVALLSSPEQLRRDNKGVNDLLNKLLQLVMNAFSRPRYRSDGFHISEPLGVLAKMFVVEERTLDYVLCHAETEPSSNAVSTIGLFIDILLKFSDALKGTDRLEQFTLLAILNVLWSISFQPSYAQELGKNDQFARAIEGFATNDEHEILEQYKPRSMESVKKATQGILINLKRSSNREQEMATTSDSNQPPAR